MAGKANGYKGNCSTSIWNSYHFFKSLNKNFSYFIGESSQGKTKVKKSNTIILHLREGGEEAVRENFFKAQQNF